MRFLVADFLRTSSGSDGAECGRIEIFVIDVKVLGMEIQLVLEATEI